MNNPFVTTGYAGPEYFCDRVAETKALTDLLCNGNNVALISPRRYGKTDLLRHCFSQPGIAMNYHTFIIDIYSTKSLAEMTERLAKSILEELKPKGQKAWQHFINALSSLRGGISYDAAGVPSWTLEVGDIRNPANTLDEIFQYIEHADRPCLVAIDEFQQIAKYEDTNVEATLRTYVQYCSNANFVFSGSHRDMMGAIFTSASRPFYQSVTIMNLPPIDEAVYVDFCQRHFESYSKHLDGEVVHQLYAMFDSTTFYMQKMMNVLFMQTPVDGVCSVSDIRSALDFIIDFTSLTYEDLLYQLPEKQKLVMLAICREKKVSNILSGEFVKKYSLLSPSSVNSAVKGLLERGLVTENKGVYQVYDLFMDIWIRERYTK